MENNNSLFEHFSFTVDNGQSPLRIDKYLMNFVENATRTKIQAAAKNGSIQVNGVIVKSNYKVKPMDQIKVLFEYPPSENELIAENIKNPVTGEVIIKKDRLIDELDCEKIDAAGVKSVNVYSVITCASTKGVCQVCYGRDLARGKLVSVGEAVGMIAAQSIGEPGTQLTMRTFHVGGTAQIKEESPYTTARIKKRPLFTLNYTNYRV